MHRSSFLKEDSLEQDNHFKGGGKSQGAGACIIQFSKTALHVMQQSYVILEFAYSGEIG